MSTHGFAIFIYTIIALQVDIMFVHHHQLLLTANVTSVIFIAVLRLMPLKLYR